MTRRGLFATIAALLAGRRGHVQPPKQLAGKGTFTITSMRVWYSDKGLTHNVQQLHNLGGPSPAEMVMRGSKHVIFRDGVEVYRA